MRFIPRTVMVGFVNALAILIFLAQLPYFLGGGTAVYGLVALGLLVMYGLPKISTAIPAPLVAIVALSGVATYFSLDVPRIGDMGELPTALPWSPFRRSR